MGDGHLASPPQLVDPLRGQPVGDACAIAVGGDPDDPRLTGRLAHVGERAAQHLRDRPIAHHHSSSEEPLGNLRHPSSLFKSYLEDRPAPGFERHAFVGEEGVPVDLEGAGVGLSRGAAEGVDGGPISMSTKPTSVSIWCQPSRGSPPAIQPVHKSTSRRISGGTGRLLAMSANCSTPLGRSVAPEPVATRCPISRVRYHSLDGRRGHRISAVPAAPGGRARDVRFARAVTLFEGVGLVLEVPLHG